MSINIENCVPMEDGKFLCWDIDDNCPYIIDLRKSKATPSNTTAEDWAKLVSVLGNKIGGIQ